MLVPITGESVVLAVDATIKTLDLDDDSPYQLTANVDVLLGPADAPDAAHCTQLLPANTTITLDSSTAGATFAITRSTSSGTASLVRCQRF